VVECPMLQSGRMKSVIGLLLGFVLGGACRWFEIPVPSPPKLLGALLVVATTVGYMTVDNYLAKPAKAKPVIVLRTSGNTAAQQVQR
jgi:XapX domain-containing protein